MNHFKGFSSVVFGTFTMLYNHHLYQVCRHFRHLIRQPCTHLAATPNFFIPKPLGTTSLLSLYDLLNLDISYKWNHMSFCHWLLSLGMFSWLNPC